MRSRKAKSTTETRRHGENERQFLPLMNTDDTDHTGAAKVPFLCSDNSTKQPKPGLVTGWGEVGHLPSGRLSLKGFASRHRSFHLRAEICVECVLLGLAKSLGGDYIPLADAKLSSLNPFPGLEDMYGNTRYAAGAPAGIS